MTNNIKLYELKSEYPGVCKTCFEVIRKGATVLWSPDGQGAAHKRCGYSDDPEPITIKKELSLASGASHKRFPMLFEHQAEIVNTVEKNGGGRLYLAFQAGAGKTLTSIASAEIIEAYPMIIVCPSVVKINWQREVKQWSGKDAEILQSKTPYKPSENIVIINYDILPEWKDQLKKMKAKSVIFDEGHYIKNPEAKRSIAAIELAKSIKQMKLILSGTPAPNSLSDLTVPLDILDHLEKFGGRGNFIRRYCPPKKTRYGVAFTNAQNKGELRKNLVNTCFVRRTRDQCLDLPEKIRVDIPVEVKVEDDVELLDRLASFMTKPTLKNANEVIDKHMTKQDFDGHLSKERAQVGKLKVKHMVDLANDIQEPLVIMVHHKEVVDELMTKLNKRHPVKLVGGMTPRARQKSIDDFQEGRTDVIVCSISAAGVGINLQRGTQMIMGELPFTYAEVDQAESRCHRSGAKNDLTVYRVVAVDSVDEIIVNIVARKEAVAAEVEDGLQLDTADVSDILASKLLAHYKKGNH